MNSTKYIIIGVIALVVVLGIAYFGSYNSIITMEEKVDNEYSNIDVQLQRRSELIPNLVNTVKGYMDHEEKIINSISEARTKLLNASNVKEMSEADNELTTALNNLNVVVENYPDLKANENFKSLQDELAGTENRISVARRDYNDAVKNYNTKIKKFPASIVASMMGKDKKDYFEASDKAKEAAPEVNF